MRLLRRPGAGVGGSTPSARLLQQTSPVSARSPTGLFVWPWAGAMGAERSMGGADVRDDQTRPEWRAGNLAHYTLHPGHRITTPRCPDQRRESRGAGPPAGSSILTQDAGPDHERAFPG